MARCTKFRSELCASSHLSIWLGCVAGYTAPCRSDLALSRASPAWNASSSSSPDRGPHSPDSSDSRPQELFWPPPWLPVVLARLHGMQIATPSEQASSKEMPLSSSAPAEASCSWLERMGKCWKDWEAVATTRNHQLCHIIHDSIQFCCCSHPLASPSQPQEKIKQISASFQIQIHLTRPQWHSFKLRKQREKTEWWQEMVDYYGLLRWSSDPAAPPCPSQPLQALSPLPAACAAICSAAPIAPRHRGARALPVLGRWQSFP